MGRYGMPTRTAAVFLTGRAFGRSIPKRAGLCIWLRRMTAACGRHVAPRLCVIIPTERVKSPLEVELWSSPLYFVLMLLVLSGEWVLRKMSQLK